MDGIKRQIFSTLSDVAVVNNLGKLISPCGMKKVLSEQCNSYPQVIAAIISRYMR